jgi:hypothetical protein
VVLDHAGDGGADHVEHERGIDAEKDRGGDQGGEQELLAAGHVPDRLQAALDEVAEDDAAVEPERIAGREDHAHAGREGGPGARLEGARERQELAHEAGGAGQADVAHGEEHEDQREDRHPDHEPAVGGDVAGVHPVVDHADEEEERAGDEAVADHLEDRAVQPLLVHREDAHGHEAQCGRRRNRRCSFFHVLLHERDEARVEDGDDGEEEDEPLQLGRRPGTSGPRSAGSRSRPS